MNQKIPDNIDLKAIIAKEKQRIELKKEYLSVLKELRFASSEGHISASNKLMARKQQIEQDIQIMELEEDIITQEKYLSNFKIHSEQDKR